MREILLLIAAGVFCYAMFNQDDETPATTPTKSNPQGVVSAFAPAAVPITSSQVPVFNPGGDGGSVSGGGNGGGGQTYNQYPDPRVNPCTDPFSIWFGNCVTYGIFQNGHLPNQD